jgi:ankyrin repeat protein
VLYESHSLIHGRPFPLKGRFFANIFIHFEPTGRHVYHRSDDPEKEIMNNLAPYILPGSPEEENWRKRNPHGWRQPSPSSANADNKPETHAAAQKGDIDALAKIAAKNARLLQSKDQNGWQPIHEAARSGHKETVELLLKHGVDMNARTWQDKGSSPLNLAIKTHGEDHPVSKYLQSLGALNIEPEL